MKAIVIPPVVEVIEPKKVVLELSLDEAHVILALTGIVNGPTDGPRGISDGIYDGLTESLGIHHGRTIYGNYEATAKDGGVSLRRTGNNYE